MKVPEMKFSITLDNSDDWGEAASEMVMGAMREEIRQMVKASVKREGVKLQRAIDDAVAAQIKAFDPKSIVVKF